MDPSGNWVEQETHFEGLNMRNTKCSKEIEHDSLTGGFDAAAKIYAELSEQLVFQEQHTNFPQNDYEHQQKDSLYKMNGPNQAKFSNCMFGVAI